MPRYLRLAGGVSGALALAFAIWFGGTVVHAANCAQTAFTPGGWIYLDHCGEYTYEGEAFNDMGQKAQWICTAYMYGTNASLYWWYREGDYGGAAYYSSGYSCQ